MVVHEILSLIEESLHGYRIVSNGPHRARLYVPCLCIECTPKYTSSNALQAVAYGPLPATVHCRLDMNPSLSSEHTQEHSSSTLLWRYMNRVRSMHGILVVASWTVSQKAVSRLPCRHAVQCTVCKHGKTIPGTTNTICTPRILSEALHRTRYRSIRCVPWVTVIDDVAPHVMSPIQTSCPALTWVIMHANDYGRIDRNTLDDIVRGLDDYE